MTDTTKPDVPIVLPPQMIDDTLNLGTITSPALAAFIRGAISKLAIESTHYAEAQEYALHLAQATRKFLEFKKVCDCPICRAKTYIEEGKKALGVPTAETTELPKAGHGYGDYL